MEQVFKNIKAECVRRGITIEVLCREIGAARRTYYNWADRGAIPSAYAVKISKYFGMSTDALLGIVPQEKISIEVHNL